MFPEMNDLTVELTVDFILYVRRYLYLRGTNANHL